MTIKISSTVVNRFSKSIISKGFLVTPVELPVGDPTLDLFSSPIFICDLDRYETINVDLEGVTEEHAGQWDLIITIKPGSAGLGFGSGFEVIDTGKEVDFTVGAINFISLTLVKGTIYVRVV